MVLKMQFIARKIDGELYVSIDQVNKAIEEKDAEIENIKAENERLKKCEKNRILQYALWISRAKRAIEKIAWFKLWNGSISTMNPEDGARQEFDKWKKNLGKFLAKSQEYK